MAPEKVWRKVRFTRTRGAQRVPSDPLQDPLRIQQPELAQQDHEIQDQAEGDLAAMEEVGHSNPNRSGSMKTLVVGRAAAQSRNGMNGSVGPGYYLLVEAKPELESDCSCGTQASTTRNQVAPNCVAGSRVGHSRMVCDRTLSLQQQLPLQRWATKTIERANSGANEVMAHGEQWYAMMKTSNTVPEVPPGVATTKGSAAPGSLEVE